MARRRPFRIAHLSDLHLTATDEASRSEPLLFGALTGMNAAFRKIVATPTVQDADLVLLTGDVTDMGDIRAWRVFWEAIKDAGLNGRVLALPGNHDVCCLGLRMPADKSISRRADDLAKATAGLRLGRQPTTFPWVAQPDPRVAIFGVNSCNLGNLSAVTNAMGELAYRESESLARSLHAHQDVPVKIVALHHSPNIPQKATAERRGITPVGMVGRLAMQIPRDQRCLLRLLCVAQGVRLLLHGHMHVGHKRRVTGIGIIGAPATTQPIRSRGNKSSFQFYVHEVQGDGGRVLSTLRTVTV